jgi:putative endonuclease
MASIYILFSEKKNRFYTGSSRDNTPEKHLKRHTGAPWKVIHCEVFLTYTEARKRELFLKTGVGRQEINAQFGHYKKI